MSMFCKVLVFDVIWTKKLVKHFTAIKTISILTQKSKLIKCYTVTDASLHDSQVIKVKKMSFMQTAPTAQWK